MKALLLNGPGQPFSIETIEDPTPQKGYAVAKVLACGSGLTIQHVKACLLYTSPSPRDG